MLNINKEEATNILIAYAICNLESGKLTCLDCPFNGELIHKYNRSYLLCDFNKNVTDEKVIEAIKFIS